MSARFALLYDDGRWKNEEDAESARREKSVHAYIHLHIIMSMWRASTMTSQSVIQITL